MNQSQTIEQMGGGSSSHKRRRAAFNGGEASEDGDAVFSAGHELVFTNAGQLSFADSVLVDYGQLNQQQQHHTTLDAGQPHH